MQNIQVIHQFDHYVIWVEGSFWSTAESEFEVREELSYIMNGGASHEN